METYTDACGNNYIWIPDDGEYMEKYYQEIDNSPNNPFAMERRTSFVANAFNALVGIIFRKDD